MPSFSCRVCGDAFTLPQHVLDRYPGWEPTLCSKHREKPASRQGGRSAPGSDSSRRRRSTSATRLSPAEVLARYDAGPRDGVFTDGGAVPNPGPGGWGAVYVVDGEIEAERYGHAEDTTNNRMELTALIEGAALVPEGTPAAVYSDSRLAVRTLTEWASSWERAGWKRRSGPVENLDLVRRAYGLYRRRPELELRWIAGHSGYRWNEYADALANRWRD